MVCYGVDFPRQYGRFASLLSYYSQLPLLMEGGHKIGHIFRAPLCFGAAEYRGPIICHVARIFSSHPPMATALRPLTPCILKRSALARAKSPRKNACTTIGAIDAVLFRKDSSHCESFVRARIPAPDFQRIPPRDQTWIPVCDGYDAEAALLKDAIASSAFSNTSNTLTSFVT
jgi:hypothetical protein